MLIGLCRMGRAAAPLAPERVAALAAGIARPMPPERIAKVAARATRKVECHC